MAHTKSARRMIRVMKERRGRNRSTKSVVKTHLIKAEKFISGGEVEQAREAVSLATVALDKAAKKGVIHLNNAARHKSRLTKKFNAAFPSA